MVAIAVTHGFTKRAKPSLADPPTERYQVSASLVHRLPVP
jgi:hypothetical protein